MRNNEQLRALMQQHGLTRSQVAELAGYTVSSVDRWLRCETNKRYLDMPDRALDLLIMRLNAD